MCKNPEGFDRIPQRILLNSPEHLLDPLTALFEKIYNQTKIFANGWFPKLFLYSKTWLKKYAESYRPIANLCATSKIFENIFVKHTTFCYPTTSR
jgi:hypothetical protein